MKNTKENKLLGNKTIVVLSILGVILVIAGIVLSSNMIFSNKKDTKPINKQLNSTEYSKYNSIIQKKTSYIDLHFANQYPINDFKKLTSEEKTLFLLKILSNYKNKEVTVEQLKKEMPNYFSTFELNLKDIKGKDGKVLYRYENEKFTYVLAEDTPYTVVTKELSSTGYKDRWILKRKIYYMKVTKENNQYKNTIFSNLSDCQKNKNSIYTTTSTMNMITEEEFDKIKDKLTTITYHFKNKKDNYVIEKVTTE